MMEESGAGPGAGSVRVANGSGCGSGRPKNIRILRIRVRNTGFIAILDRKKNPYQEALRGYAIAKCCIAC
jgi:hypothetical protein